MKTQVDFFFFKNGAPEPKLLAITDSLCLLSFVQVGGDCVFIPLVGAQLHSLTGLANWYEGEGGNSETRGPCQTHYGW